jgi:hypothetical protein
MDYLLSTDRAAKFLCISVKTLEAMRLKGTGPNFVKPSQRRVAYRRRDLEAFVDGRVYSSTSEYSRDDVAA